MNWWSRVGAAPRGSDVALAIDRGSRVQPLARRARAVAIVGVSPAMKGGIASVMQVYRAQGLEQRVPLCWIATAGEGSAAAKIGRFVLGLGELAALLVRGQLALAHLMVATGGSFWRKALIVRLCRLARVPVVFHVHSGLFDRFYAEAPPWQQRLIAATLRSANTVIALGGYWQRCLQQMAPQAQVVVIPNGVAVPPRQMTRTGLPGDRPLLLFLGRLLERKGVFDAITAFATVAPRRPALRLMLCGDGDPDPVRAAIARLPADIAARIDLPGWVEADDQPALFARAAVLLLPSLVENLPMCVLEAQAHGVPVIATPVGAVPDAVIDGVTGRLVAAGDVEGLSRALEDMTGDALTWRRMSLAAREHVEARFSAAAMIDALDALYRPHLQAPTRSCVRPTESP